MACSWRCSFELAHDLRDLASKDATRWERLARAALSRFYYSLYHRAADWSAGQSNPWKPDMGFETSHKGLWKWLASKASVNAFWTYGYDTAHSARCTADYYIDGKDRRRPFDATVFESEWETMDLLHQLIAELPNLWPSDDYVIRSESLRLRTKAQEMFGS